MANLLDPGGCGEYATDGFSFSGQMPVYGGGGMRRQLVPQGSENEVLEAVQHYALVPIWFARLDSVTMEHELSGASLGAPSQPVMGGQPSPTGLTLDALYDPNLSDLADWNRPQPIVRSPQNTTMTADTSLW